MRPIAQKTYYSIGEVSDLAGLKTHVLRYWESQFDVISPTKRGGKRVYRMRDIETILLVKHLLYEKKFTLEGARRELQELRKGGKVAVEGRERADPAVIASIRKELKELRDTLTLPDG